MKTLVVMLFILASAAPVAAKPSFDPRLGAQIDIATTLTDQTGTTAPLGEMTAGKPALVLFGYNKCPNLCGTAQIALAWGLSHSGLGPNDYRVLFVTVDPHETTADAKEGEAKLVAATSAADAALWRFVTGRNVTTLATAFGVSAEEQVRIQQFVHPEGVIALTPDGRIAQVLGGVDFPPETLRLAVVEASQGKLGTLLDHIKLFCNGFDTSMGQYSGLVKAGLQIGGLLTLLLVGLYIALTVRRERRP